MAIGHGSEPVGIDRVREEVDQLGKMVVGYEGVGRLEELEFGGVCCENLAQRTDLHGAETFGFEYLVSRLDAVVLFTEIEHPYPQLVNIEIGGKGVTVGIDKRQA
jgi:hypothetical protein